MKNADEVLKQYERISMIACLNDEMKRLDRRSDELFQLMELAHSKGASEAGKLLLYEAEMAMIIREMELVKDMLEDTVKSVV